ncbi:hypothetical protein [Rhodocaloribacter sp.]
MPKRNGIVAFLDDEAKKGRFSAEWKGLVFQKGTGTAFVEGRLRRRHFEVSRLKWRSRAGLVSG